MERIASPLWHGPTARPGVELAEDGGFVAVSSAHADALWFCTFDPASGKESERWRLTGRDGTTFHGFVPGLRAGTHYGLRADGPYEPHRGHWFDPSKLLADPYATRLSGPWRHHPDLAAPRHAGIDTAALVPRCIVEAPQGSMPRQASPTPRLIYEVAVKAFSKLHPGIPAHLRGTIAALAEPALVEHLLALGVSHVELMPIFAWMDERHLPPLGLTNAWGYNPVTMMALDPRLAPGGLAELRHAVEALHQAGISVLLDVVFNHTAESDERGPTVSLRGLDNASYYRLEADGSGRFVNDTGCGNTLACDHPFVQRLVLDTMKHFVQQAGVDGFRFDLATILGRSAEGFSPHAPMLQMMMSDPDLAGIELIAEPWDVGPGGYHVGGFPPAFREWNDRYRDDIRKFWGGEFGAVGALATRLAGSADLYAQTRKFPSSGINFVAAHDGFALKDVVSYVAKHNEANGENNRDGSNQNHSWNHGTEGEDLTVASARLRDLRAILATLFLSRGLPMLTAGDEFGRTQGGNNNAYAQDNAITWLHWADADLALQTFVADLMRLRMACPPLHADAFLEGLPKSLPDVCWLNAEASEMTPADWQDRNVLAMVLTVGQDTPAVSRVYIAFNRGWDAVQFRLPSTRVGAWHRCLDSASGHVDVSSGPAAATLIEVPARGVMAFVDR